MNDVDRSVEFCQMIACHLNTEGTVGILNVDAFTCHDWTGL